MKQDIREHSDLELSLLVYNDDNLYQLRNNKNLIDILDKRYLYTEAQLRILKRDLKSEVIK